MNVQSTMGGVSRYAIILLEAMNVSVVTAFTCIAIGRTVFLMVLAACLRPRLRGLLLAVGKEMRNSAPSSAGQIVI